MKDRRRPESASSATATARPPPRARPRRVERPAPPLPFDVSFHVPAEVTSVSLVRRLVQATLKGAGVDQDLADDVTLATNEACTNVVLHGARGRGAPASYFVTVHIASDRCVVSVAEREGAAHEREPSATSLSTEHFMADTAAEHGRGIALMALLMDGVELETDPAGSFRLQLEKGLRRPATRVHPGTQDPGTQDPPRKGRRSTRSRPAPGPPDAIDHGDGNGNGNGNGG